jgi:hypothetical protein
MGILRHVVGTPPGPRFHAVGDKPEGAPRRERRHDSPAGLAIATEVTARRRHGRRGADACSGRRARAGSRPVMQTWVPSAVSPMAEALPMSPVPPVTRTDFPAMRGA